jgi:hypothetical protein
MDFFGPYTFWSQLAEGNLSMDGGIPQENSRIPQENSRIPQENNGTRRESSRIPEETEMQPNAEPDKTALVKGFLDNINCNDKCAGGGDTSTVLATRVEIESVLDNTFSRTSDMENREPNKNPNTKANSKSKQTRKRKEKPRDVDMPPSNAEFASELVEGGIPGIEYRIHSDNVQPVRKRVLKTDPKADRGEEGGPKAKRARTSKKADNKQVPGRDLLEEDTCGLVRDFLDKVTRESIDDVTGNLLTDNPSTETPSTDDAWMNKQAAESPTKDHGDCDSAKPKASQKQRAFKLRSREDRLFTRSVNTGNKMSLEEIVRKMTACSQMKGDPAARREMNRLAAQRSREIRKLRMRKDENVIKTLQDNIRSLQVQFDSISSTVADLSVGIDSLLNTRSVDRLVAIEINDLAAVVGDALDDTNSLLGVVIESEEMNYKIVDTRDVKEEDGDET